VAETADGAEMCRIDTPDRQAGATDVGIASGGAVVERVDEYPLPTEPTPHVASGRKPALGAAVGRAAGWRQGQPRYADACPGSASGRGDVSGAAL
jgi:hypothetical protein